MSNSNYKKQMRKESCGGKYLFYFCVKQRSKHHQTRSWGLRQTLILSISITNSDILAYLCNFCVKAVKSSSEELARMISNYVTNDKEQPKPPLNKKTTMYNKNTTYFLIFLEFEVNPVDHIWLCRQMPIIRHEITKVCFGYQNK